ncbi:hypothetical protein DSM106972_052750 [Dulcicalothrix desertica PCC 7102]|uniref:Uncharacterized protein n=1 Tax=Dulcicalothrix desertica PCC 7102 TaxID=232991 RepID=A0A3S1CL31_9CYAN|nr:hypothetical protein [Dulcicalothrix desertica]RUT03636.1 hypothetical protein DSM106972_052750 [Dulcicalothrix desertica PCC 7102]TWH43924.1 hypothetical protein CAL7102_07676 [Dulcicalothrix desertica PCC 7102]
MFSLLDFSAFETSASVQAINDILFPVVLFVVIFWLMCEVFLVDVAVEDNLHVVNEEFTDSIVQAQSDKDNTYQKAENDHTVENLLADMATTIDEYTIQTELSDIDIRRQNLKALGVRKLRDFCRNREIKGHAAAYRQRGLDGLVEFLFTKQIYAHYVEQQFKHVE